MFLKNNVVDEISYIPGVVGVVVGRGVVGDAKRKINAKIQVLFVIILLVENVFKR